MNIYIPYFYIIEDTRNGVYYAGARWAKNCHPKELLEENGYTTSSKVVNEIIKNFGIDVFIIRKIRTFKEKIEAEIYEKKFLVRVDAKNNHNFYNNHNGDLISAYGSKSFETYMIETYGVKSAMNSSILKEKHKNTMIKRYGVVSYSQTEEYKDKRAKTCIEKYGVDNYLRSEIGKESLKNSMLFKYGVENAMQLEEVKQKIRETSLSKYGVNWYTNRNKAKETCINKYGVNHRNQTNENKQRQSMKSDREIVKLIKIYVKTFSVKLKRGWYQKSDQDLNIIIKELILKYGSIN